MTRSVRPFHAELAAIYRRHLGRALDAAGYFHYASRLEAGQGTLAGVEAEIAASDEARRHHAQRDGGSSPGDSERR